MATCLEEKPDGERVFQMEYQGIFLEILEQIGLMPLPPYIHKNLSIKIVIKPFMLEIMVVLQHQQQDCISQKNCFKN